MNIASKMEIFNQSLTCSLLQPLSRDHPDFKSYRTKINLKILEQRNESSGEKEVKFEISRRDDFEFLFAEVLNNEKYQILAKNHDLTVDFDTFPKVVIQHLLCKNVSSDKDVESRPRVGLNSIVDSRPTEITIILDIEKTSCSFELFAKTPVSKGKLFSIKLIAVRGDQLIAHLLKICSGQSAALSSLNSDKEVMAELKLKSENSQIEIEKLRVELSKLETKHREAIERNKELEDELELVKEERENIRVLAEEKEVVLEELQAENENYSRSDTEIKEELEIVGKMLREEQTKVDHLFKKDAHQQKEIARLRKENASLSKSLDNANKALKNNDHQQHQRSVDLRKLKELEADLEQKDSMIVVLTEKISSSKKELDDEKLKLREMGENCGILKAENEELKEKLTLYRSNRLYNSPSHLTAGVTPITGCLSAPRSSYRPVLGAHEAHLRAANLEKISPFRDASRLQNPTTPFALRNATNFIDESPVTKNPV